MIYTFQKCSMERALISVITLTQYTTQRVSHFNNRQVYNYLST